MSKNSNDVDIYRPTEGSFEKRFEEVNKRAEERIREDARIERKKIDRRCEWDWHPDEER